MPQLGSDSGKFYTKENQKKYEEGWDRIFKK
jgi:hypothetical protein